MTVTADVRSEGGGLRLTLNAKKQTRREGMGVIFAIFKQTSIIGAALTCWSRST